MPHSARTMEPTNVGYVNAPLTTLDVGVNAMRKIWASMVILKQVVDLTILQRLSVTTEEIVFAENVNAIQEKIL